jgi:hypothetical protein
MHDLLGAPCQADLHGSVASMRAVLVCVTFLLTACGAPPKAMLARRHAAQFRCGEAGVAVQDLGGNTWLVDGCGTRATYKCTHQPTSGNDADCILEAIEAPDGTTSLPSKQSK